MAKEVVSIYSPEEQMADFLRENPKGHYNDEPDYDYKVSSGSLNLDLAMQGGPKAGIVRLVGLSGGGKSSCAISFIKNFYKQHDKARAIIIPSEGSRLETLMKDSNEPVVTDHTKWENKTAFSYRTNIYENAMKCIRHFVEENPENYRYVFVVDSIDALVPQGDIDKPFGEATKVAGGALLASTFGKTTSLMITSRGHLLILISQVRKSKINVSQYAKHEESLIDNVGGGNALIHYADWIFVFNGHSAQADRLWEGEVGKSKAMGHFCEIDIVKAPRNIGGTRVRYPIKYLSGGQSAIWTAYEVADMLITWEQAKKAGAWITVNEEIVKKAKDAGFELPAQHQGINKFRSFFEENPELANFIGEELRKTIII